VKFLINSLSVTYSSFFFASRPFFVCDGDSGDDGELDFDGDDGEFPDLLWFSENIT